MNIPRALYSKNIISFIKDLISLHDAKDFYSLDEIHQDKLVSLGLLALNGDIDIVLSQDVNSYIARCLVSFDRDNEIDLLDAVKEAAREKFSAYFNQMIEDEIATYFVESMNDAGKHSRLDRVSGELTWI